MAREQIQIRRGESIFIDFPIESDDNSAVTIAATMTASFTVTDEAGAETETGALVKDGSSTQFELKITDTMTTAWAAGNYVLDVLVDDSSNGYANYILEADIIVT